MFVSAHRVKIIFSKKFLKETLANMHDGSVSLRVSVTDRESVKKRKRRSCES